MIRSMISLRSLLERVCLLSTSIRFCIHQLNGPTPIPRHIGAEVRPPCLAQWPTGSQNALHAHAPGSTRCPEHASSEVAPAGGQAFFTMQKRAMGSSLPARRPDVGVTGTPLGASRMHSIVELPGADPSQTTTLFLYRSRCVTQCPSLARGSHLLVRSRSWCTSGSRNGSSGSQSPFPASSGRSG